MVHNPATPGEPIPVVPSGVVVHQMPENLGYAGGMNAGMAKAKTSELLLLCTDDVRPRPGAVHRLLTLAAEPSVGLAGPRLVRPDDTLFSVGGTFNGRARLVEHRVDASVDAVTDVEWLDGALLATTRSKVDEVGGFDDRFFLYQEDVEWSLRFRASGYRVVVDPGAVAVQSPGGESRTAFYSYYAVRNGIFICRRHFGWGITATRAVRELARAVVRVVSAREAGSRTRILRARWAGLRDGLLGRSGRGPRWLSPDTVGG